MATLARMNLVMSMLALFAVACGGADDRDAISGGEGEEELRTAGITRVVVGSSAGFLPPPPTGECYVSGHWIIDFQESKLQGNACVEGTNKELDRDLTRSELSKIRAKVSALKSVRKPTSCPTDMPIKSITIEKGDSSTHYVDQRAACGGGVKAVKEAELGKLVDLLVDLSKEDDPNEDLCSRVRCMANNRCVVDEGIARCVPWMPTAPP